MRVLGAEALVLTATTDRMPTTLVGTSGINEADTEMLLPLVAGRDAELLSARGRSSLVMEEDSPTEGTALWDSLPIREGPRLIGALHMARPDSTPLDRRLLAMLTVIGESAAMHVREAASPTNRPTANPTLEAARLLCDLALVTTDYEHLVGGVTGIAGPFADCAMVGVSVLSEVGGYFQLLPGSFGAPDEMVASAQVEPSESGSGASRVVATGMPTFSNDARTDLTMVREWIVAMGIEQLMTHPLFAEDRIVGLLMVANHRTHFTSRDVRRLALLTPFVASTLEHVRRGMALRRKETLGAVVSRAATAVAGGQPLAQISSSAYAEFARTIDACTLAITFGDESAPRVLVEDPRVPAELRARFLADSAAPRVATRTVLHRPSGAGDAGSSALHAPVTVAGKREATLSLLRIPGEPFTEDERQNIRRLTNVTALAWATERYEHERSQMVRMQERQRLADDLHDHVAQILFSGKLALQSVIEQVDEDQALLPAVSRARDLLIRSELSLRDVMNRLSTPNPDSFVDRLTDLAQTAAREFDLIVDVDVRALDDRWLSCVSGPVSEVALRATREAVVNAAKHAAPSHVWVEVNPNRNRMTLSVTDDGVGLPPFREGYGLRSIRRQVKALGGRVRIITDASGRSRVTVSVPLQNLPANGSR
jgi:signal transduction histidine kinase